MPIYYRSNSALVVRADILIAKERCDTNLSDIRMIVAFSGVTTHTARWDNVDVTLSRYLWELNRPTTSVWFPNQNFLLTFHVPWGTICLAHFKFIYFITQKFRERGGAVLWGNHTQHVSLSLLWEQQKSRDISAEAGFICDKAVKLDANIKEITCIYLRI